MTDDLNSRARQLLEQICLKEPSGDPPEIVAQYERLVAFVGEYLRQVANETREAAPDNSLNYCGACGRIILVEHSS